MLPSSDKCGRPKAEVVSFLGDILSTSEILIVEGTSFTARNQKKS